MGALYTIYVLYTGNIMRLLMEMWAGTRSINGNTMTMNGNMRLAYP